MGTTRRKKKQNRVSVTISTEHGFASFGVDFKSTDDAMDITQKVYNDISVVLRTMSNLNATNIE